MVIIMDIYYYYHIYVIDKCVFNIQQNCKLKNN